MNLRLVIALGLIGTLQGCALGHAALVTVFASPGPKVCRVTMHGDGTPGVRERLDVSLEQDGSRKPASESYNGNGYAYYSGEHECSFTGALAIKVRTRTGAVINVHEYLRDLPVKPEAAYGIMSLKLERDKIVVQWAKNTNKTVITLHAEPKSWVYTSKETLLAIPLN